MSRRLDMARGASGIDARSCGDLVRDEEFRWRIGELAQDGLTSDHDEIPLVRDRGCRTKNVLEIGAPHALYRATVSRRMRCRVFGSSANENGLA